MAYFCTILLSKTDCHHLHHSTFVWTSKCCMRFYSTSQNNTICFSSIFINKYISSFFIYTYLFNFHRRNNWALHIIFCNSITCQNLFLTFCRCPTMTSHSWNNKWICASGFYKICNALCCQRNICNSS